jgi:hypothetical protein
MFNFNFVRINFILMLLLTVIYFSLMAYKVILSPLHLDIIMVFSSIIYFLFVLNLVRKKHEEGIGSMFYIVYACTVPFILLTTLDLTNLNGCVTLFFIFTMAILLFGMLRIYEIFNQRYTINNKQIIVTSVTVLWLIGNIAAEAFSRKMDFYDIYIYVYGIFVYTAFTLTEHPKKDIENGLK